MAVVIFLLILIAIGLGNTNKKLDRYHRERRSK
jgi:hypothetical protein